MCSFSAPQLKQQLSKFWPFWLKNPVILFDVPLEKKDTLLSRTSSVRNIRRDRQGALYFFNLRCSCKTNQKLKHTVYLETLPYTTLLLQDLRTARRAQLVMLSLQRTEQFFSSVRDQKVLR